MTENVEAMARYNIAPSSPILAVRRAVGPAADAGTIGQYHAGCGAPMGDDGNEAVSLRWGLIPSWAKSLQGSPPVNARAESLAEKPMFRDALRLRRCVILASGFYEWERRGTVRLPWLFQRMDGEPFLLAGLWDSWRAPDGGALESGAIITTQANAVMSPIHHRMPVMLDAEEARLWLEPQVMPMPQVTRLTALLRPWADGMTSAVRVSTRVNNVRFEGPECMAAPETGEGRGQSKCDDAQMQLGL